MNPPTPPPSRPLSWLAAVALLLAGAVVGIFAGRWSGSSGANARESSALARDSSSDTTSLDDLRRSIDELSRALRDRPTALAPPTIQSDSASPDRQLVLPDLAAFDRLASTVDRLDELLRSGPGRTEATPGAPRASAGAPLGPGYPSIAAMRSRVVAIRGSRPDDFADVVDREFSSAHVLWTREEVIARYGLPLRTDPEGDHGLALVYSGLDDPDHWDLYFYTRIEPGSLVTGVGPR